MEPTVTSAEYPPMRECGYLFQLVRGRPLSSLPHRHDFYEMLCVLSGSCTHSLNGELQPMAAGEGILLRPCDAHFFTAQSNSFTLAALSVVYAHMDAFFAAYGLMDAPDLARTSSLPAPKLCFSGAALPHIRELAEQTNHSAGETRTALCAGLLSAFLTDYTQCRQPHPAIPADFRSAMDAMREPANLRAGVPAFRRLAHFSSAQLCRLTQRYLAMSPQAYVLQLRLQTACEWLQSDLPLEVIAEQIGFSSYSHFHQQFKRAYGVTPAQMRKNGAPLRTV